MRRKNSTYIFAPEPKKRNRTGCLILFMAIGFAVVVLGLLTNAAMNRRLDLQTEKVRVMSLDKKFENFTLLHISDLHGAEIGLNADAWRSLLYGKDFSAVVMTGDMVGAQGDYSPLISLVKTLRQIKAGVPVYLIAGDEDPTPVVSNLHGNPEVLAE